MRRISSGAGLTGLALLAVVSFSSPALAWYPTASQCELATATWCQNCPQAYAGIEALKGWFDVNEFNAIRYYAISGGLSNDDAQGRLDYYGVGPLPEAIFDGTLRMLGADEETETGVPYRVALESILGDPSPFKITINAVDLTGPDGSIDLDIQVMETLADIGNMYLRMALTEDDVDYAGHDYYDDITRDMLDDEMITVDELGEIQNVQQTFAIDPTWVGPLKIVAFIQDDDDKSVLASGSTLPNPDYSFRYYLLGDRIMIGPSGAGVQSFDFFHLFNTGNLTDDYTISVELDAPEGWSAVLCEEGICWGPVVYRTLDPGEEYALKVEVEAPTPGCGIATVTITQDNVGPDRDRTFRYIYITDDLNILLVDDDPLTSYESYFEDALDFHAYDYGLWDRNLQAPTAADLANFPIVLWTVGDAFPTVDEDDRTALAGYLDGGGNLFLTGQDIGYELEGIGGDAYQWYQDYLHAILINDDSGIHTLDGVDGDPVSSGIDLVIEGGDGADNQNSPDDIDPADGSATVVFTYDETRNGAIRADTGTYRIVYFAFGFEGIDNASDRRTSLRRIIRWFQGTGGADQAGPVFRPALGVLPNPVQSSATARFTLPQAGEASLRVFGPDGRLLRVLASGSHAAGNHVVTWDRTDSQGARVPAGVYYYTLDAEGAKLARKVVVLQ